MHIFMIHKSKLYKQVHSEKLCPCHIPCAFLPQYPPPGEHLCPSSLHSVQGDANIVLLPPLSLPAANILHVLFCTLLFKNIIASPGAVGHKTSQKYFFFFSQLCYISFMDILEFMLFLGSGCLQSCFSKPYHNIYVPVSSCAGVSLVLIPRYRIVGSHRTFLCHFSRYYQNRLVRGCAVLDARRDECLFPHNLINCVLSNFWILVSLIGTFTLLCQVF